MKTIDIKGKRKPMSVEGKAIRKASVHRYWEGKRKMFLLKSGYLMMNILRKRVYVHRMVWEKENGAIPNGFHIHHKNGIRTDNRIENLEIIEANEHSRMHAKNSGLGRGEKTIEHRIKLRDANRKVTDEQILTLHKRWMLQRQIAEQLGVKQPTISTRLSTIFPN